VLIAIAHGLVIGLVSPEPEPDWVAMPSSGVQEKLTVYGPTPFAVTVIVSLALMVPAPTRLKVLLVGERLRLSGRPTEVVETLTSTVTTSRVVVSVIVARKVAVSVPQALCTPEKVVDAEFGLLAVIAVLPLIRAQETVLDPDPPEALAMTELVVTVWAPPPEPVAFEPLALDGVAVGLVSGG
jgi:hypothetical protein